MLDKAVNFVSSHPILIRNGSDWPHESLNMTCPFEFENMKFLLTLKTEMMHLLIRCLKQDNRLPPAFFPLAFFVKKAL